MMRRESVRCLLSVFGLASEESLNSEVRFRQLSRLKINRNRGYGFNRSSIQL